MPRTHGYSARGERCYGVKDWQAKGRVNVIGALLGFSLLTASLFTCNINSEVFHTWVIDDLLPKLPEDSVVVMDDATFHKRRDTQRVIREAGHILEFLPAYSPDLNPIEHKWAQAKSIRRATGCSAEELFGEPSLL